MLTKAPIVKITAKSAELHNPGEHILASPLACCQIVKDSVEPEISLSLLQYLFLHRCSADR